MQTGAQNEHWRELYEEAILENDSDKISIRISEAQKAIQERTLQLWYQESLGPPERERLHTASRSLEVLRICGERRGHP